MRLCFVASLQSVHTARWVRYFAAQGHEVFVVTPVAPSAPLPGIQVKILKNIRMGRRWLDLLLGGIAAPLQILRLQNLFRRIQPDLVHVHYLNDVAWFSALTGVRPFVATAWGSDVLINPHMSVLLRVMTASILRRSDLITCDAVHLREAMTRLGADPRKIRIVHFGTDVRRFHREQGDPTLRARLGLDDSPVVISLRRLDPLYDVGTLIAAVPGVLAKMRDVKFVIAGEGPEEEVLRTRAASSGVSESIRFVGQLSEPELPGYLAIADVYVSTALSDGGLAASTAEAMACQLPVIVTDVAANREWVQEGINGFLVPPGDPQALASHIVHLLQSPRQRAEFGERGRRVIVERNNWETQMAQMVKLYEEVLARGRTQA